jgi:outer membrane phospholipase A
VNIIPAGAAVSREEATTLPTTKTDNPLSILTASDPNFQREMGLVEFLSYRVKAHEPVYIVAGDEEPSTKFQFSFKYQIFDPVGPVAQKVRPLGGLYFGYTQTAFWDLGDEENSNPFYDTSYRPELMVSYDDLDRHLHNAAGDRYLPNWINFGFQAGLKHESNGQSSPDSRSVNIVYARPIITFEGEDGLFVTVAPSVWAYVFDLSDNEDIENYRGYADLRLIVGRAGGLQIAATGRLGEGGGQGSVLVDVTYPVRALSFGNIDAYLDVQYFNGYGESILNYNQNNESVRFGISLVR